MKIEEFIAIYGNEKQEVTDNFVTKSISTNYNIKDSFIEFGDNSYDARIIGKNLEYKIDIDNSAHTINIYDNGHGVKDASNLFKLGGTNKDKDNGKIGKYGIGVPGASSSIAKECIYDKNEIVQVIYTSAHKGNMFEKRVAFNSDGTMRIGTTEYSKCDVNEHFTNILFKNVILENTSEIIGALEETFENPLQNGFNISFNGRQLGKSNVRTFIGDEPVDVVKVGDDDVEIRYRIIGGNVNKGDREFEEAGLRIYDKNTGRLLGKSTKYWNWFVGREAQPNICGLRAGIWIDSSLSSYTKFGILPAKNGVKYKQYYKQDDFKELSEKLSSIYRQAANTTPNEGVGEYKIGSRVFIRSGANFDGLYHYDEVCNSVLIKKGTPKLKDIAALVNENINLKKRLEKNLKKKCITNEYNW